MTGWLLIAALALGTDAISVHEAINIAISQSPEVQQADFELKRANVLADSARAERLTYQATLNVGEYAGVYGLFGQATPTPVNAPTGTATVLARLPLFSGYRLTHQIAQAEASVSAGQARAAQARQDLVWRVVQAYWTARRGELRMGVQTDAVTKARAARSLVQTNVKIGTASANELDRVEVTLLNEESEQLRVQEEARAARDQLGTLLQRDLTGMKLFDPPTIQSTNMPTMATALETARMERPDVKLANARFAQQQSAVGVAQAERWPQLEAISSYQHGNNPFIATSQNRNVLSSFVGTLDARLNLSYNLLDNGTIRRNIEARELESAGAAAELEAARRAADLEVRQAIARQGLAARRLALGERSVTLATKNLTWLEGRFKFGYAVVTELNEARQTLKVAANQRIDALIDHQLAEAALAKAMGTLSGGMLLESAP